MGTLVHNNAMENIVFCLLSYAIETAMISSIETALKHFANVKSNFLRRGEEMVS